MYGISSAVAVVLLVLISIAVTAFVYLWLSGSLEYRDTYEGSAYPLLKIDSYRIETFSSGRAVKLYVHSLGGAAIDIDSVYVNGIRVTSAEVIGGAAIAAVPTSKNVCVYLGLAPSEGGQGKGLLFEVNASVQEIEIEAFSSDVGLAEWSMYIAEISVYPIYPHFVFVKNTSTGEIELRPAVAYVNTSNKWVFINGSAIHIDWSKPHLYKVYIEVLAPKTFNITWWVDNDKIYNVTVYNVNASYTAFSVAAGSPKIFRPVGIDIETKSMVIVHSAKAYICPNGISNGCTLIGVADRDSGYKSLKPMYLKVSDNTYEFHIARADRAFTVVPGEKILLNPHTVTQVDAFIPNKLANYPTINIKVCSRRGACAITAITG